MTKKPDYQTTIQFNQKAIKRSVRFYKILLYALIPLCFVLALIVYWQSSDTIHLVILALLISLEITFIESYRWLKQIMKSAEPITDKEDKPVL